jgi:hypothetical protein
LPESTLEGQSYEEGQESVDLSLEGDGERDQQKKKQSNGDGLWNPDEESYYSQGQDSNKSQSSGRWHYPANFEDTISPIDSPKKSSSKKKKDRWARTEDAYSQPEERRKKKSKKVKRKSSVPGGASIQSGDSTPEFPEDPTGGLYGERGGNVGQRDGGEQQEAQSGDDVFHHEF